MTEKETAESTAKLAGRILDRPSGDPDDDLAVLSRQFLRARERLEAAKNLINRSRPECAGGHATLCGICHACKALAAWRKVKDDV